MAFCHHCGSKFEEGGKFCAGCGKPRGEAKPGAPRPPKSKGQMTAVFVAAALITLIVLTGSALAVYFIQKGGSQETAEEAPEDVGEEGEIEAAAEETPENEPEDSGAVTADKDPAGWQSFEGQGFALALPPEWEGGSARELDLIIEELKSMGPQEQELAREIELNRHYLIFWAYDSDSLHPEQLLTNVNMVTERVGMPLSDFMEATYSELIHVYESLGYQADIREQDIVSLGGNEKVGRTIFEQVMLNEHIMTAQYIIPGDNIFYILTFSTGTEDFKQYQEIFDQAAGTVRLF